MIDLRTRNSRHLEAFSDRERREARPVLDTAKAFLLERGEEPAIFQQNGGDIAMIGVDAKYVHMCEFSSGGRMHDGEAIHLKKLFTDSLQGKVLEDERCALITTPSIQLIVTECAHDCAGERLR